MSNSVSTSGRPSSWLKGVYEGAAVSAVPLPSAFPYRLFPIGTATPPAAVVEDIERPTTRGTGSGEGSAWESGGGGASVFGLGVSRVRSAILIGGGLGLIFCASTSGSIFGSGGDTTSKATTSDPRGRGPTQAPRGPVLRAASIPRWRNSEPKMKGAIEGRMDPIAEVKALAVPELRMPED